jgi:hypothetical protein
METLVFLLVGGVAAAWAATGMALRVLALAGEPRRRAEAWRAGARRVALSAPEETDEEVVGWVGDLRVRLAPYGRSNDSVGTDLTIAGPALASSKFSFRPESLDTTVLRRAGRNDVQTGDAEFDRLVWVTGDEALARAVLDAPTRAAAAALVRGQLVRPGRSSLYASGSFEEGRLRLELPESLPLEVTSGLLGDRRVEEQGPYLYLSGLPEHLPEAVDAALALARKLVAPRDVPARLLQDFRAEPEAGVRLRLLECLAKGFPRSAATSEAVQLALADTDSTVRVEAAVVAGSRGRAVLLGIAHGEGAADETSARAVSVLAASLTVAESRDVLRNALRLRKLQTVRACLRILGARGGPEALDMLTRVLAVERGEPGDWAAESLGSSGDPAAESPLLRELTAREEHRRVAVARALGRSGTVAAVPALRSLEERDPSLRRAAREAVALIQSRKSGAEPGQLSLADDARGQLSVAESEDGRLSFASSHESEI